ncbi:MAG: cytochrome c biogenesis protein CcsA, partial [Candidatus Caenarcaniphilales bacterium]|nr:cytochrome c biogenesis protein CcsA [Candidatus Caenarcaniphilales bacterium]
MKTKWFFNQRHPEELRSGDVRISFKLLLIAIIIFFTSSYSAWILTSQAKPAPQDDIKNHINANYFKQIPIQDEGRIKPLDTYARYIMLRFSGKESAKSINELASIIFEPEKSITEDIFLINDPETVEALGLSAKHSRKYSFKDLQPAAIKLFELAQNSIQKEEKSRSRFENEILRVFSNFNAYSFLADSISFTSPHPNFALSAECAAKINLTSESISLLDLIEKAPLIAKYLQENNKCQKEYFAASYFMYQWIEQYKSMKEVQDLGFGLNIIPVVSGQWFNTWDSLIQNNISQNDLQVLQNLKKAYINQDQKSFDLMCQKIIDHSKSFYPQYKITLELIYNQFKALKISLIIYLVALIMLFFKIDRKYPRRLIYIGLGLHLIALIFRIMIMSRAPVTNLFETFIFISLISVASGLTIDRLYNKDSSSNNLGLIISSFTGFLLLLISEKFAAEGDSFKVLIAVLDSNFWLSTHVIAVTIGYAIVFCAGIAAHLYLVNSLRVNIDAKQQAQILQTTIDLVGVGLCFSFLGTMLGGIWADQSWGRFWGWDPKENGALMIVLYTAAILHARMDGMLKAWGLAFATSICCIVVVLSWFGINLLGVGLHSYGFNKDIATIFWSYM